MSMKNTIYTIIIAAAFLTTSMHAADRKECKGEWKEKMQTERIAFLTMEMGLTPEEAQAFWPVYNQACEEKDAAMFETMKAHKELAEADKAGKGEKEISALLDKYLQAVKKQHEIEDGLAEKYKAVLPVGKVAKQYIGEEKFRRQHIRKLHKKPEERK